MKVKCSRGWGKVVNPLTGDEIDVSEPFETEEPTFKALRERYGSFEVVDPPDEPVEEPDEPHICGVEKSDGEPCSREVESPDARCWQHE